MEKYIDLRLELESMASQQLAQRLREETGKEVPDDDLVLLILGILEERDADKPVQLGSKSEEAWKVYQQRVKARAKRPSLRAGWLARAAIVILVATILFAAIPQEAQADSFWDRFSRWTKDIVEFFSPKDNEGRFEEYQFTTDNPGLQQVYDAVVEMGVTEPVVPMWLPDGYELIECKTIHTPAMSWVLAVFTDNENEFVYRADLVNEDISYKYHKDESVPKRHVIGEIEFNIVSNNNVWTVIWEINKAKCSIFVDCQEDTLYRILESIYVMEDD